MTTLENIPEYIQQTLVLDSKTWFDTYPIGDYDSLKEIMLQRVTSRMREIEAVHMAYNGATNFGNKPNGQETEIENLLEEWDNLKALRTKAKTS